MRVFSYVFHGLLTLFLLAISVVAWSSGQPLQLEMLPWQGQTLTYWLLCAALVGLASVILAICRRWRTLFFLWSLAVLATIARGFFFSHYYFAGLPEFRGALYLTAGALIDRKSTRLNSSHRCISYAVFCLKKKNENTSRHGLIVLTGNDTVFLDPSDSP